MKTLIHLAKSALIVACLFLVSCSKDSSSSSSNNPTPSGSNYFKLNGTLITLDSVDVTVYDNATGGRYIDVYGFKGTNQVLELHMPAAVGNYPAQHAGFTSSNSWLTYQTGGTESDDYFHSDSGAMNVTTFNESGERLVGTFEFVGNNGTTTKNITEGHLDLSAF
jgi:hypothetical protein